MSQQVKDNPELRRRLRSPWHQIVILERLARGGGTTRWFFVRTMAEFYQVSELLRGGSCVSFYFANQLNVEADTESTRQRLFDEVVKEGELVIGYPSTEHLEIEMEIVNSAGELTEVLVFHPEGSLAVWGKWPARVDDGLDGITINLVDVDGIPRAHPH